MADAPDPAPARSPAAQGQERRGADAPRVRKERAPVWLTVGMIALIGLNLRASLGALPPLLSQIDADLRLSSTEAGLLTSVTVVFMGLCAPVGQRLARRVGVESATGLLLVLLATAGCLRMLPGAPVLFITGAVAGGALGAASALMPALIGHRLASVRGLVTGIYSASLALGVAIAAGTAVPLERLFGDWRPVLALWGGVAGVTAAGWFAIHRRFPPGRQDQGERTGSMPGMPWSSPTARWVAYFLAAQMVVGFSALAWIPPLYTSHGLSDQAAAQQLVVFQLIQLVTMVTFPALTDHVRDRRPLLAAGLVCLCAGLILVLVDPVGLAVPAMLTFGAGVGAGSTLGLVLIVDGASDQADAARVGAMAFLVAFLAAASGPALVGLVGDLTGSLDYGFGALLALALVTLATVGVHYPGRQIHVEDPA